MVTVPSDHSQKDIHRKATYWVQILEKQSQMLGVLPQLLQECNVRKHGWSSQKKTVYPNDLNEISKRYDTLLIAGNNTLPILAR